ncbi:MAG TPA: trypsin-like peptidase domain-containing protein [Mycobacteriales bacterium]|nr:trypsin-like peptidase domain-containing protein [Mycobacteriales bacterium]
MLVRSRALLAAAAVIIAATAVWSAPAGAAGETIQPGAYSETAVGGCTLNFVYNGTGTNLGKTFIGTAAHCVKEIGDEVSLASGEVFGDVAFIGDENSSAPDFAFIQVRSAFLSRVSPAVKGYPAYPTGVTSPQDTVSGDLVQISGHGLGFGFTAVTQEKRVAVMGYDDADVHEVTGPIDFGDSGGPLVHVKSGKALGIVSRLCIGLCSEEGPTVAGLLAKANAAGFGVTLRTV